MKYVGKNGLKVGDNEVWHEGNFDPDDKQEKLGYTPVNKAGDIIDSSTSTHMKLRLHTEKSTTDEFVGIAFGVDISNKYMKSSIAHIRKGSNGQGDLVILLDGTASGKNVGLTDEKMRITKDGNVGIATNNPTQKLDVSGRIRMRTQTVASDGDDIVTTKKYVDDSIPTSLPANGGNAATVNGKTVKSNVPANAKFTDTIYTHPSSHPASMITESTTKRFVSDAEKNNWNSKAEISDIPTKVGQLQNDKNYVTQSDLGNAGYGDMVKSIYDTNNNGIVDNAEKVNGFTVGASVPANAKFTDTIYTHPTTHPASMITGLPTSLPADGGQATSAKHLIGDDTRAINSPPSEYMNGGSRYLGRAGWQTEFKSTSTIGVAVHLSGTYCFLETKTPWSDPSGGYPIQIAYGNGFPVWRIGVSVTTWGSWQSFSEGIKIITSATEPNNLKAGDQWHREY